MTQPPLSRQIAALEQEMAVQLFERHSRSVGLTPAGASFYQNARRILEDCEDAVRQAQATERGERGELRIGFTMCAAWSVLPAVLASFRHRYPDVQVRLKETLPNELDRAMASGEVDIGISFPPQMPGSFGYRSLVSEAMLAVLPSNHRLAQQSELSVEELAEEPFVTFPAATAPELHHALLQTCRLGDFQPTVVLETQLQQTIVNLVAGGLGVSLVPESMQKMNLQGASFRSLRESCSIEQGIYWLQENRNPCLLPFIDIAFEASKTLCTEKHV